MPISCHLAETLTAHSTFCKALGISQAFPGRHEATEKFAHRTLKTKGHVTVKE